MFFGFAVALLPPVLFAQSDLAATAELPDAPTPQIMAQATAPAPPTPPQSSASAAQATTAPAAGTQGQTSDEALKAEEKQRLLGIMPAFSAVEEGQAPPLSPRGKFELWYKSAIDPFTFVLSGINAGIEQAENSFPEYHQGFAGFAKRYGSSYADTVDGNFWGNAVLPILFKQDPRYFRLGHGLKKRRLVYALVSTVRCKGDNGKWQPSYANVLGNLIGGGISNAYYPASDRGAGLTFERGLLVTAEGALGAIAFEFYPDLVTYFKQRHDRKHPVGTTPAPDAQP